MAERSDPVRSTAEDLVERHVRDGILSHRLRPGDHLVADALAHELGVSRLPVRQALQRLAGAGLIEMRPHRGAIVAVPDDETVHAMAEVVSVRRRLEPWSARLAAERRTEAECAHLRSIVRAGKAAAEAGSPAEAATLHHDLISSMVAASHNRALVESLRPLLDRTVLLFGILASADAEPVGQGWEQHAAAVDAIERRDGAGAADAVRRHLDEVAVATRRLARGPRP